MQIVAPQQAFPQRAQTSIKVANLTLQETGTYNPMFSRPYQLQVQQADLDNIATRVDQVNGAVSGALLAGIAGQILRPQTTAIHQAPIPNGWQQRRIRFVLEVHVTTSTGNTMIYFFQGYTDYPGVSFGGQVDPKMQFIINSFIKITRAQQMTSVGYVVRDIITESAQVINGQIIHSLVNSDVFAMRPQDIFTGIESNYINQAYNSMQLGDINDTRIRVNNNAIRSNRINNIPANYIAKVVDNYQTSVKLADFGQGEKAIYGRARDMVYEVPVQENPFIRAISDIRGIMCSTTFSISELAKIDPNVGAVTKFHSLGPTQLAQLHQAGQSAYWNSVDRETIFATTLSNAVPALMMDCMVSHFHFRATNHDIAGNTRIDVIKFLGLTNMDLTQYIHVLKTRIEKEVLFDATYGNQFLFAFEMEANLFGQTKISVSLDNGTIIEYVTPSFCDSLLTPIMTVDKDNFFGVVNGFEGIMNNITHFNNGDTPAINMSI